MAKKIIGELKLQIPAGKANPSGITICTFGSSVVIVVSSVAKPFSSTFGVSSVPPPEPPPISFSFLSKVSFIYFNTSLSLFAAFWYSSTACCDLSNIPPLNTKLKLTPASINNTIRVIRQKT